MPEQISKYPEVTLKVLQGAGAKCGEGVEPKILKKCPPERFCSLRTGEICVYGIEQIPQMTQITTAELARVVCPAKSASIPAEFAPGALEAALLALAFVAGLVVGRLRRTAKRQGPLG